MGSWKKLLLILFIFLSADVFAQETKTIDTAANGERIFEKIEVEASYPGGPQAWKKYLERSLRPEVPADRGAPAGLYTVLAKFIVDRNGNVSGAFTMTNFGYDMEKEVLRVINNSGKWNAGMQNNRFVNSYHIQPISFMLTADGYDITTKTPNVLFTNTDNELIIDAGRVKPQDLKVEINKGAITEKGNGKYIAIVTDTSQRAVITIYNAKRNNKEIGSTSFEVRAGRKALDAKKE